MIKTGEGYCDICEERVSRSDLTSRQNEVMCYRCAEEYDRIKEQKRNEKLVKLINEKLRTD